jgi:hypothetical protein
MIPISLYLCLLGNRGTDELLPTNKGRGQHDINVEIP